MTLAREVRSGLSEATHLGAVAAVDVSGKVLFELGDVSRPFFFRSAIKPFQATVSNELGADLGAEELAVASASHWAQPIHVSLVRSILMGAGLDESALQCPPAWPISPSARHRLVAAGATAPRPVFHNCSGKHAALLRACVARGWPIDSYRSPDHPGQRMIIDLVSEASGEPVTPVGVDGCGFPTLRGSVMGLARAFARLADEERFAPVRDAMHRFPALTSDGDFAGAAVATWVNGAAKGGSTGCIGMAVTARLGVAVKCWDGSSLAKSVAMIETLDRLGLLSAAARRALAGHARPPIRGGGLVVGNVEPVLA